MKTQPRARSSSIFSPQTLRISRTRNSPCPPSLPSAAYRKSRCPRSFWSAMRISLTFTPTREPSKQASRAHAAWLSAAPATSCTLKNPANSRTSSSPSSKRILSSDLPADGQAFNSASTTSPRYTAGSPPFRNPLAPDKDPCRRRRITRTKRILFKVAVLGCPKGGPYALC